MVKLSRRQRTDEAILRATLDIILSGKKLTKTLICSETPCSPATLFRFYPDIEVARANCFRGAAAKEYSQPFYKGVELALDRHSTLINRLTAIIDVQNAYVHTHLTYIKEVTRASLTDDSAPDTPAKLNKDLCHRLAQDTLGLNAALEDINMLEAQLQQLIGFNAMLSGYQVASSSSVPYIDHSKLMAKAILSQLKTSTQRHRLMPLRDKPSVSSRLQSVR